jgi:hypothetical protein
VNFSFPLSSREISSSAAAAAAAVQFFLAPISTPNHLSSGTLLLLELFSHRNYLYDILHLFCNSPNIFIKSLDLFWNSSNIFNDSLDLFPHFHFYDTLELF